MNDSLLPLTPPILDTGSPPPKCAICLGACSNKCFSDSCMHEFCFSCLMEWSKIKAECPLCKKPFKSILHNIKSNEDYEEYIVADTIPTPGPYLDLEAGDFLYMQPLPSRHFQFRTTFTVDPGGELAIQQMLLSHPLTTNNYNFPLLPRYRSRHGASRPRGVSSATSFRRSIYALNLWVSAPPDLSGRYRDITPDFYRDNPSARNRLVPWLNRELNALLRENTQQVMNLVDIIMEHLPRWHIRSRAFRNLLLSYMNDKTDHFLHEFYNFMRSPYDMIGYDRHISYAEQPTTYTFTISDYDDDEDSDVAIVSEPITIDNNPFRQPTIEVIEINSSDSSHDSDVVIRDAPVEIVDLLHSDSDNNLENDVDGGRTPTVPFGRDQSDNNDRKKPLLPLKIRLKRKHQSREKVMRKKKRSVKRYSSCSACNSSSDSSDSSSSSSSESSHHRSKKRHKYKKSKSRSYKEYKNATKDKFRSHKYKRVDSTSSSSSSSTTTPSISSSSSSSGINSILPKKRRNTNFDSDDNIPLSKIRCKEIQNKSTSHTITSKMAKNNWQSPSTSTEQSQPSCSLWQTNVMASPPALDDYVYNFPSSSMYSYQYPPLQGFSMDTRSSYPTYQPSNSHYVSPSVSSCQQTHLSYTPPVDSNLPFYKNEYHYETSYNQDNNRAPMCVNIGVGTSPLKNSDVDEYHGSVASSSNDNHTHVKHIFVKKEHKPISPPNNFLYQNDSSDSNN